MKAFRISYMLIMFFLPLLMWTLLLAVKEINTNMIVLLTMCNILGWGATWICWKFCK